MLRSLATIIIVCFVLVISSSSSAFGILINFEGLELPEGSFLTTIPGVPEVSFSGAILILPGEPNFGFNGIGIDDANSGATISAPDASGTTVTVTFNTPIKDLIFDVMDIETSGTLTETFTARVYDASIGGNVLHTITIIGGDLGTGNGILTPIDFSTGFVGTDQIQRLEFEGFSIGTTPGYAVDNLAFNPKLISLSIFFGEDLKTDGNDATRLGSTPNADAARSNFLGNLTTFGIEDFEGFSDGDNPTSLTFGTETGTLNATPNVQVRSVPDGTTHFGLTPSSGNNLLHQAFDLTFDITFNNPQTSFGFFGTDIGDGNSRLNLTLHHTGGGTTNLDVPHSTSASQGADISGTAIYYGVISEDSPFDKVTVNNSDAINGFGFDDITLGLGPPPNQALSVDGVDGYVTIPYSKLINPEDFITAEVWAKIDALGRQNTVSNLGSSGCDYQGWGFSMEEDFYFISLRGTDDQWYDVIVTEPKLEVNTWYHFALTYSSSQGSLKFYLNGELIGTNNNYNGKIKDVGYAAMFFGQKGLCPENSAFLNGQIDEVRIWNIARTQAQIQADMNRSLTGSEPGLVAYYRFDTLENLGVGNDGLTDDVRDFSGNGNHGDLVGGASLVVRTFDIKFNVDDSTIDLNDKAFKGKGFTTVQEAKDGVEAAVQEAVDMWESLFFDPVTVVLDIKFESFSQNNNLDSRLVAVVDNEPYFVSYEALRKALTEEEQKSFGDMTAVDNLPIGSSLNFITNFANGDINIDNDDTINNTALELGQANAKALGFTDLQSPNEPDATIIFNTDKIFDFDQDDGIDSDEYDFVGVAMHEIGHALGFFSGVDEVDKITDKVQKGQKDPKDAEEEIQGTKIYNTLDLYRYSELSVALGNKSGGVFLDLDTGDSGGVLDGTLFDGAPYFSINGGQTRLHNFATGIFNGDGFGAGHWKKTESSLEGIMGPKLITGESRDIQSFDILAFDVIGWDLMEGTTSTNPVLPLDAVLVLGKWTLKLFIGSIGLGIDFPIWIDPDFAVGYDYEVTSGQNFASVTMPTGIGDDVFSLFLFDQTLNDFVFQATLLGGATFDFTSINPLGVSRFRILGIEENAELDPDDPFAFPTGVTFVSGGDIDLTMTPISEQAMYTVNGGGNFLDGNGSLSTVRFSISGTGISSVANSFTDVDEISGSLSVFDYLTRTRIQTVSFSHVKGALLDDGNLLMNGTATALVNGVLTSITFEASEINGVLTFDIFDDDTDDFLAGGTGQFRRSALGLTITPLP